MKRTQPHRLQVYRANAGVLAWRCPCGEFAAVEGTHREARQAFRQHVRAMDAAGIVTK